MDHNRGMTLINGTCINSLITMVVVHDRFRKRRCRQLVLQLGTDTETETEKSADYSRKGGDSYSPGLRLLWALWSVALHAVSANPISGTRCQPDRKYPPIPSNYSRTETSMSCMARHPGKGCTRQGFFLFHSMWGTVWITPLLPPVCAARSSSQIHSKFPSCLKPDSDAPHTR